MAWGNLEARQMRKRERVERESKRLGKNINKKREREVI
jgi:hypothetical protein